MRVVAVALMAMSSASFVALSCIVTSQRFGVVFTVEHVRPRAARSPSLSPPQLTQASPSSRSSCVPSLCVPPSARSCSRPASELTPSFSSRAGDLAPHDRLHVVRRRPRVRACLEAAHSGRALDARVCLHRARPQDVRVHLCVLRLGSSSYACRVADSLPRACRSWHDCRRHLYQHRTRRVEREGVPGPSLSSILPLAPRIPLLPRPFEHQLSPLEPVLLSRATLSRLPSSDARTLTRMGPCAGLQLLRLHLSLCILHGRLHMCVSELLDPLSPSSVHSADPDDPP